MQTTHISVFSSLISSYIFNFFYSLQSSPFFIMSLVICFFHNLFLLFFFYFGHDAVSKFLEINVIALMMRMNDLFSSIFNLSERAYRVDESAIIGSSNQSWFMSTFFSFSLPTLNSNEWMCHIVIWLSNSCFIHRHEKKKQQKKTELSLEQIIWGS